MQNHQAEFLMGYAESIGRANSTIAELTALRRGLELVLENGWSHVWLEGDAKTLVEIIVKRKQVKCVEVQKHVSHINSIINQELNSCIVSHIYRVIELQTSLLKWDIIQRSLKYGGLIPLMKFYLLYFEDVEGKIVLCRRQKHPMLGIVP